MTDTEIDWRMTACLAGGMLACVPLFKAPSVFLQRKRIRDRSWFYLLGPVGTPAMLAASKPASLAEARALVTKSLGALAMLGALYAAYSFVTIPLPIAAWGYLSVPIVLLVGEALGPLGQLMFMPLGHVAPPLHVRPWAARSLPELWGQRWNTWVSGFFHSILFQPLRRRPLAGLTAVFLFSGLLHEVMINLPLYRYTGHDLFGSQLLYFSLQGTGVAIDRAFLYRSPRARRALLWLVAVGPAPLIVNEGLLRILHLWPPR